MLCSTGTPTLKMIISEYSALHKPDIVSTPLIFKFYFKCLIFSFALGSGMNYQLAHLVCDEPDFLFSKISTLQ